ncbi:MAG: DUF3015 family protein [Pseudomonadota bacterium]
MKIVLAAAAAALVVTSSVAVAQTTRSAPNPWLDCGIGAMIFPDENLEIGAGLSNIVWDLGTTAVISAQASPDTCNGLSNVDMAHFILQTEDALEMDIASGSGDYLNALGVMAGATDADAFNAALRASYADAVQGGQSGAEAIYNAAMIAAS